MDNSRFKFRAWDNLNKKIVKATSIDFERNMLHFMDEKFKENPTYINDFQIMQWTGFQDKNGLDIYEGDIVKLSSNKKYQIKYGNCSVTADDPYCGGNGIGFYLDNECKEILGNINAETSSNKIKVIGNIYENPELLSES